MPDRGPGRALRAGLPTVVLLALVLAGCSAATSPDTTRSSGVSGDFAAAAKEFNVPQNVLLAVSYNMTNWQFSGSAPNEMGGYGPMGLIAGTPSADSGAKDDQAQTANAVAAGSQLAVAAKAAGVATDTVRADPAQNIRAAAALLAANAKNASGTLPTAVSGWYASVAKYSLSPSTAGADAFADDVFGTLRKGVTARAGDGETLTVPADASLPMPAHTASIRHADGGTAQSADCPSTLDCRFVPAAYDWSSSDHSNPNNYGNYDPANRPADGDDIQYIIIHDTESSYDAAITAFQNSAHEASANYVIRSSDGQVTQMVPNGDLSWDVANWTTNQHSISIEHEGYATQGSQWYTSAMYQSSAALVRYLANEYHIPLDRKHIIAHEDVSGELTSNQAGQHWDPGPFWDWQTYMGLLGQPIRATGPAGSDVVTIDPKFATNQPTVTSCTSSSSCSTLPAQGANFVYLRTGPSATAPLINDPLIHPDGSAGTTQASDWSDKAVTGHQYAVAGQQGDWTAIWFDGQKAWFDNPHGSNTLGTSGQTAGVPSGSKSVPLYGRAFPELSEYPSDITVDSSWAPTPLTGWTFSAGQSYAVVGELTASNYFARFDPANVSGNHTLVTGNAKYLVIDYNHRYLFVKASDVTLSRA
ncbi:MAG TPA: peptidoglycan recognition family protein [Pseudonocardiaceae bacterium]|nr:peptidoglycan recognition family protein [Pseudonocardiaceae bacterium]